MKGKLKKTFIVLLIFAGIFYLSFFLYVRSMRATETYPADTFLKSCSNKKAMIITAHDDDNVALIGTISGLASEGWQIKDVCLTHDPQRMQRFKDALKQIPVNDVEFMNVKHRNDLDTNKKPYMPLSQALWKNIFNHDTVYHVLENLISGYNPTVIFSLDDSIGAYGHPDHVFISKMVLEICRNKQSDTNFNVQKVYQGVYTNSLEESMIVKGNRSNIDPYGEGKKIYRCNGMPEPDVEIEIVSWGKNKKNYYNAFGPREKKNIKKFVKYYDWFPSWIYFRIFNREFFRVLDVKKL